MLDPKLPLPSSRQPLWSLHQLGLYRSVVELAEQEPVAFRQRELAAAVASSAALGHSWAAGSHFRRLLKHPLSCWRRRRQIAITLAPHAPALALRWLEETRREGKDDCADLRIALLCSLGRLGEAARLLPSAKATLPDQPELRLQEANLLRLGKLEAGAEVEEAVLACLARYFEHFGLEPPVRRDETLPLNAGNADVAAPLAPPGSHQGPLVSVIMTAFETGERIHYALRSLLAQTHRNLEILVMDDASGDDLGTVVTRLRQEDARIRYFRLPRNVGTYVAKELALRHLVRGNFVTCHDSDDWSHPRKIELQLEALLRHPKRVFSWSYWLRVQDDGLIVARQSYPLLRPNLSSVLFRRDAVLDRAGGYDQVRTGADSEFLARLQIVFGRQAGARLRLPLSFGALRSGSLMTDSVTGINGATSTTPFRLAYWEAWRQWHLACLQQGRRPRMPERAAQRPYPVPEGQAGEPGPDLLEAIWRQEEG